MFEREIKFITDFTLNKIKRLGSFFTISNLNSVGVHPSIIQYLSSELDYLIYLDRQRLLQKSLFDYSGKEILKHFEAIGEEIKKQKLIAFEDAKRIVQQAVMFNVNFVVRPKWTIMKFIFDGDVIRNVEEVKLFLNYSYFYDYYKKILTVLLDRKNILSISNIEFEEVLDSTVNKLIESQKEVIIEDGLIAISEFFNIGEVTKSKISVGNVEVFLKEKSLHDEIFKIRGILSVDPKEKFDIEEIRKALKSELPYKEEEVTTEAEEKIFNQQLIDETTKQDEFELSESKEEQFESIEISESDDKVSEIVFEKPNVYEDEVVKETIEEVKEESKLDKSIETFADELIQQAIKESEQKIEEEIISATEEIIEEPPIEQEISLKEELDMLFDDEMEPQAAIESNEIVIDENEKNEVEEITNEDEIENLSGSDLAEFSNEVLVTTELENDNYSDSSSDEIYTEFTSEELTQEEKVEEEDHKNDIEDESEKTESEETVIEEEFYEGDEINYKKEEIFEEEFDETSETEEVTEELPQEEFNSDSIEIIKDEDEIEIEEPIEEDRAHIVEQYTFGEEEKPKPKSDIDIFSLFTEKETYKIVKVVFGSDSIDFANTMESIVNCSSLHEAKEVLNGVFLSYKINPSTSKEAYFLQAKIEEYFSIR